MQVNEGLNYTISLKDLFNKNFKRIEDSVGRLDGKMGKLNNTASKLSSGLAAYFSISAIKDFGSAVIDSLKNYEYFSASLRTLLHGDTNAANALNGQLINLAKVSPFSLVDVQDSSKKLLAYGFEAKDIVKTMTMLGDVSSATGNQIGDVAYLYGTLRTQGVAMTKDLREFTNRGINLIPLLAKQFKIAEKDVYSFASEGKIGFKDIEKAFQSMTSSGGDFFNMMNEQSKTVGGKISNLGDAWEQLKVNIGKSQTGIISGTVTFLNQLVSQMSDAFGQVNKMDEAIKKYGGVQHGFLDRHFFKSFQINKDYEALSVFDSYVNKSENSMKDAYASQASINRIMAGLAGNFKSGKLDYENYKNQMALAKYSLGSIDGNISLLKQKMNVPNEPEKKDLKKDFGGDSTTEISGSRPQNIYITIQKQVENLTIATTNLKEGVTKAVDILKQGLAESVNDINTMAR